MSWVPSWAAVRAANWPFSEVQKLLKLLTYLALSSASTLCPPGEGATEEHPSSKSQLLASPGQPAGPDCARASSAAETASRWAGRPHPCARTGREVGQAASVPAVCKFWLPTA